MQVFAGDLQSDIGLSVGDNLHKVCHNKKHCCRIIRRNRSGSFTNDCTAIPIIRMTVQKYNRNLLKFNYLHFVYCNETENERNEIQQVSIPVNYMRNYPYNEA